MAKKEIKKPTASTEKVSKSPFVDVVVIADKFGTYKKGDVIEMHESTAKGCIKNKAVKLK